MPEPLVEAAPTASNRTPVAPRAGIARHRSLDLPSVRLHPVGPLGAMQERNGARTGTTAWNSRLDEAIGPRPRPEP